jgi:NAD(P)-dependent dehydrogenase (short-subunit alcohol dehydrogenase family)
MKHVIISGCSRGIGAACVKRFLDAGYCVTGMGRSETADFSDANFNYVRGDLSSTEDRNRLVASAKEKFGRIDSLVNVAGVAPLERRDLLDMTEESYDRVMDINTKGTLFLTQAVAREMITNPEENGIRGYICNISSLSAYTSSVSRGEYCISKAGVSMVTKLFADRLAEYGIPVNEVRPGIINTDMTSKVKEKYDNLIGGGLLPIARWGEPKDIADAVFALTTGALPYVTGQSLDVDGGFHLRRL